MSVGFPPEFVARVQQELPDYAAALLAQLCPAQRFGARLNALVTDPAATRATLAERFGDAVRAIAGLPDAVALTTTVRSALIDDDLVRGGALYLQNPSSMLPVLALQVEPGQEVLDLAAAPGGKTLHIAALMAADSVRLGSSPAPGPGRLAAVEAVKSRFFRLRENLRVGGAADVHCYLADGRQVGRKTRARFDRVLLDAPCSSEARFDSTDATTWAHWSPRKVHECVRKQRALIASAFAALKPGGRLVYSTCALSVAENEGVIDWLLGRVGTAAQVLPWPPPVECVLAPGVCQLAGRTLHADVRHTLRVRPDDLWDGFYVAVLRKDKQP